MFSSSRYVIHFNKGKNVDFDEQGNDINGEENVNDKSDENKKELK